MASYMLGVVLLAAMVLPPAWAAPRVRRRWLPESSGTAARVIDAVIWISHVTVVSEVAGGIGLFRRFVVAGALAATGVAAGVAAGDASPAAVASGSTGSADPAEVDAHAAAGSGAGGAGGVAVAVRTEAPAAARARIPSLEAWAAAAIAAVFAFPWMAWLWAATRSGIINYDSLAYHLPFAAQWARSGSMWHPNVLAPGTTVPYHPSSAEIFHSLGLLAFRTALISPYLNVGWLVLAGAAAWAIGDPFDRGPHCLALGMALIGSPVLLVSQPGSAMNDLTLVALALAAVAIYVQGPLDRRRAVVFGMALGLVAGTKLDGLPFVGVAFVGAVVLAPAAERLAVGGRVLGSALVTGGFFYLRNFAAVGSPIPGLHTGVFPQVSAPVDRLLHQTVAQYATNGPVIHHYLIPGLKYDFGPLWPVAALVAGGGAVASLWKVRSPMVRVVAVAALATIAAWAVTPTSAGGATNAPTLLVYNVRYATVGLVVGAVILALLPQLSGRRAGWVLIAAAAVLSATFVTRSSIWPDSLGYGATRGWHTISVLLVAPFVVWVAATVLWAYRHPTQTGRAWAVTAGVAAVLAVIGGYAVKTREVPHWYSPASTPVSPVLAWAGRIHHASIGTVQLQFLFSLYNTDLSNAVKAVGLPASGHAYVLPVDCVSVRRAIDAGHYDYVVVASNYTNFPVPVADPWVRDDGGAAAVYRVGDAAVYRITRPLDPATCPA